MRAQQRSTIILAVVALGLFLVRWPIDEYTCNPNTWHSQKYKTHTGQWVAWMQPFKTAGGKNFFATVFAGGSGTPAIFAMLGGQREMIANIMWNYTDVIWHGEDEKFSDKDPNQRMLKMVSPMEAAVTLNPYFLEAWTLYGWHMAWNVHSYVKDPLLKAMWLDRGENAYIRAVEANPDKPGPYFDLAWLYKERRFQYKKAMIYYRKVVYNIDENGNKLMDGEGKPLFQPMTPEIQKRKWRDTEAIRARYWEPRIFCNQLAYVYKKLAVAPDDDTGKLPDAQTRRAYYLKAIETYELGAKLDPKNTIAQKNADEITKHMDDPAWIAQQYDSDQRRREQYRLN